MGLEVKGLSVEYNVGDLKIRALENITFEIKDGESVGIAGESACGKSTLGRAILRSLDGGKATSGYIYADGEQILSCQRMMMLGLGGSKSQWYFKQHQAHLILYFQ